MTAHVNQEWQLDVRRRWSSALDSLGLGANMEWTSASDIDAVLNDLFRCTSVFAILPGSGFVELNVYNSDLSTNFIEMTREGGFVYRLSPKALKFQYLDSCKEESFFLLDLESLSKKFDESVVSSEIEHFVVDAGGGVFSQDVASHGVVGYDDDGADVYISNDSKHVLRYMAGSILLCSKASRLNLVIDATDGRHERMSLQEIRQMILDSSIDRILGVQ